MRVLAVFPEMDLAEIERFRARWDPLAAGISAHVTVAFPFEWPGPARTLVDRLRPVLAACTPFTLGLSTPTVWEDEYLFLLVDQGREEVQQLHESIYAQALPGIRPPARFVPHLTIGRNADKVTLLTGAKVAEELTLPITGTARTLTLYRKDCDRGRVREIDLPFGRREADP